MREAANASAAAGFQLNQSTARLKAGPPAKLVPWCPARAARVLLSWASSGLLCADSTIGCMSSPSCCCCRCHAAGPRLQGAHWYAVFDVILHLLLLLLPGCRGAATRHSLWAAGCVTSTWGGAPATLTSPPTPRHGRCACGGRVGLHSSVHRLAHMRLCLCVAHLMKPLEAARVHGCQLSMLSHLCGPPLSLCMRSKAQVMLAAGRSCAALLMLLLCCCCLSCAAQGAVP